MDRLMRRRAAAIHVRDVTGRVAGSRALLSTRARTPHARQHRIEPSPIPTTLPTAQAFAAPSQETGETNIRTVGIPSHDDQRPDLAREVQKRL